MRLINVQTLDLEEYYGRDIPRYAILSHRWGNEEITFHDWQHRRSENRDGKGYLNIRNACNQAALDGLDFLWCDTNCIDKSSSSELSEAINSMFAWYRDSVICYAYLSDVPELSRSDIDQLKQGEISTPTALENADGVGASTFARSHWFTRGWTLQELLASREVRFYSQGWVSIGEKNQLAMSIARAASIDYNALKDNPRPLKSYSFAAKMSWASLRETTRLEDEAYCLLGIFGVQMPLLYGDGAKAFERLQSEMINRTPVDQSVLAWWNIPEDLSTDETFSLPPLAPSPAAFTESGRIESVGSHKMSWDQYGLTTSVHILGTLNPNIYFALLGYRTRMFRDRFTLWPGNMRSPRLQNIWIPLLRSGRSQNFRRIQYASSRLILLWPEPWMPFESKIRSGFGYEQITIENRFFQDDVHGGPLDRLLPSVYPRLNHVALLVLVHDGIGLNSGPWREDYWHLELSDDTGHSYVDPINFPCPQNTTTTQTYYLTRVFRKGRTSDYSSTTRAPRSRIGALRISITRDPDGKPSKAWGTTLFPLHDYLSDAENVQWSDNDSIELSSGLKTVRVADKYPQPYRCMALLEGREPIYSNFRSFKHALSPKNHGPSSRGRPRVLVGRYEAVTEWKDPSDLSLRSGWCIPLVLQWVDPS